MAWTVRYVRADAAGSGDGTTHANSGATGAFTLAEAITNSATVTNVQYVVSAAGGAFANTTTNRIFNGGGTAAAPHWWRGSNSGTTVDDCELDPTLAKPQITFTTGQFRVSGANQTFSNLDISGATTATNGLVSCITGVNPGRFHRCRCKNTAANSVATAFKTTQSVTIVQCYFEATSTASAVLILGAHCLFEGNVVTGGGVGISNTVGGGNFVGNTIRSTGSHGYEQTVSSTLTTTFQQNTIYNAGGDAIRFTALPDNGVICNNVIANSAGYGINNVTGTVSVLHRFANSFYSNTSGEENGFGDSPHFNKLTESSSPFTSAAGGDFSLVTGALSKASGQPGRFENQSYTSYLDRGAVQRLEAGGVKNYAF